MSDIGLMLFDTLRLIAFTLLCNFVFGLYKWNYDKRVRGILIGLTAICIVLLIICNHYIEIVWR